MKVSIEEKKEEALKRLKMLGIYAPIVKAFKDQNEVSVSEPPFGALYFLEDNELDAVRKFEKEHDCLVYLVVRAYTSIGKMDSYLLVSDYREEWASDRADIKDGIVFTYTVNYDWPDCSEFGSIGYQTTGAAGIVRTA